MIPDWKLERYIQGSLSELDMMQIRFEESQDEVLRARIASLKKSDEEILSQYPSEKMIPELIMKANKKNKNKIIFYFPMVAAAVLLVAFIPFYTPDIASLWQSPATTEIQEYSENGTRIKGLSLSLEVWKKTGDSAEKLVDKGYAKAGNELQLRYSVPTKCYGIIFSLDGNGKVTALLADQNSSVAIDAGKISLLPYAYKLDDAPHFEKFFLVISSESFDLDANQLDSLLNNKKVQVVSFMIKKELVLEGK